MCYRSLSPALLRFAVAGETYWRAACFGPASTSGLNPKKLVISPSGGPLRPIVIYFLIGRRKHRVRGRTPMHPTSMPEIASHSSYVKRAGDEPIPGYTLIEPL